MLFVMYGVVMILVFLAVALAAMKDARLADVTTSTPEIPAIKSRSSKKLEDIEAALVQ